VLNFTRRLMKLTLRRRFVLAFAAFLSVGVAAGQEPSAPVPRPALAQPASVTVRYAGSGVIAPVLFPPSISIVRPRHCVPVNGVVKLSAVVDENGVPRSIQTLHSDDARLNDLAMGLAAQQRFKPGTYNGSPGAIAIELTAALHTCAPPAKKKVTEEDTTLTLSAQPFFVVDIEARPAERSESQNPTPAKDTVSGTGDDGAPYKIGANISAPVLIHSVEAEFSDSARRARICGVCVVSLIVDANGMPQNVNVIKSLEPSLDQKAVEAIEQYRFKPALKDGVLPVPVQVTVEVDFHLYKKGLFGPKTINCSQP